MSNKLDSLVAERVMGWPVIDFAANAPKGGYIRLSCCYRGTDHPTDRCGIWQPSTDIKAAWEVVEKMGRDGFTANVQWKGAGRGYEYTAEVSYTKSICTVGHATGEAPIAICLAALRACGVTEQDITEAMQPNER